MKPNPVRLLDFSQPLYKVEMLNASAVSPEFHFHDECQITLVITGNGKKMVGDSVTQFEPGELVLVGPGLPHVWATSEGAELEGSITAMNLLFGAEWLFKLLVPAAGAVELNRMLTLAERGLIFYGKTKEKLVAVLWKLSVAKDIDRLILLLEVIKIVGSTDE